jgi:PhnB protein
MNSAIAAGATILSPAQDYDYGYRQGKIKDPFGHIWMIEKNI